MWEIYHPQGPGSRRGRRAGDGKEGPRTPRRERTPLHRCQLPMGGKREGKDPWAICPLEQSKNWMKGFSGQESRRNPQNQGRDEGDWGCQGWGLNDWTWRALRSGSHTSPRCLGVGSGSPGRAGWIRRQQHDLCGSHLARKIAEHEAGGWAAGMWEPGLPYPLPSLPMELGPAWPSATKHIPQGTPPQSPHREGEGRGTRHPQGLGKGN